MWHASVAWQSPLGLRSVTMLAEGDRARMWRAAEEALAGVGDSTLGEFREELTRSLHLKRRVTPDEWGERPWGMDYRRTFEGQKRLGRVLRYVPTSLHADLLAELTE